MTKKMKIYSAQHQSAIQHISPIGTTYISKYTIYDLRMHTISSDSSS